MSAFCGCAPVSVLVAAFLLVLAYVLSILVSTLSTHHTLTSFLYLLRDWRFEPPLVMSEPLTFSFCFQEDLHSLPINERAWFSTKLFSLLTTLVCSRMGTVGSPKWFWECARQISHECETTCHFRCLWIWGLLYSLNSWNKSGTSQLHSASVAWEHQCIIARLRLVWF